MEKYVLNVSDEGCAGALIRECGLVIKTKKVEKVEFEYCSRLENATVILNFRTFF